MGDGREARVGYAFIKTAVTHIRHGKTKETKYNTNTSHRGKLLRADDIFLNSLSLAYKQKCSREVGSSALKPLAIRTNACVKNIWAS